MEVPILLPARAFALLHMGGMQEVMVSSSPLTEYGLDFVRYEFFLGLGDALPAFLLCIVLCILHCAASADVPDKKVFCEKNFIRIMSISSAFFAWRLFGYITGIVDNEMEFYPAPVLAWTFVFGIIAVIAYCLIDHTLPQEACRPKENVLRNNQGNVCPDERTKKRKMIRFFAIIGVNWIWFNCYIGLIAAYTFWFMVLRAGADVLALVIGGFFSERIIEKG